MNRLAKSAARYRETMNTGLRTAASLTLAVADSGDLPSGRSHLVVAAQKLLGVMTAEDIRTGRQPERTALALAVDALAMHERSLKPTAVTTLTDLRRLLAETKES